MNKDEIEMLDEDIHEKDRKLNNQRTAILMLEGIIFLLLIIIAVILIVPHLQNSEKVVDSSKNRGVVDKKDIVKEEKLTEKEQNIIDEKSKMVSKFFSTDYPFEDVGSIPNQELLRFAERNIRNAIDGFSREDVETIIKNYFGDVSIQHENISCDMVAVGDKNHQDLYLYDGEGKYTYNEAHGGHGICNITPYLKLVSSKKIGNHIEASYRILYSVCCDICGETTEYYSKLPMNSNTIALQLPREQDGSVKPATEEQMNGAYEKSPITHFNYEIDSNGEFYLESVYYE